MPTILSYKKKILETTHIIATTEGNVKSITFEKIALAAGITVKNIEREYSSMEDIFYDTGCMHIKSHAARSKKILTLTGEYAMGTMIKHDLGLLIYYTRDSAQENLDPVTKKVLVYVKNYIETEMPEHYFKILVNAPSIIPNKNINAKLYAQFIVHSMFFYTKEGLTSLEPDSQELTKITQKLIASLFSRSKEELKIE
jgi:hypothetical protein